MHIYLILSIWCGSNFGNVKSWIECWNAHSNIRICNGTIQISFSNFQKKNQIRFLTKNAKFEKFPLSYFMSFIIITMKCYDISKELFLR